jgi:hypothetical protein
MLVRIALDGAPGGGFLYLMTVTPPGDNAHRMPSGTWCPCTPHGGVDLADWNPRASEYWNVMRGQIARRYGGVQYMRVVEVQDGKRRKDGQGRGGLHLHILIWSPEVLDKAWLRRSAVSCGFGHEFDLAPIAPGSRKHAYYVAKYVTKSNGMREEVPWRADVVDTKTGEITEALVPSRHRGWSSSRGWGLTMRAIRQELRDARDKRHAAIEALAPALLAAAFGLVLDDCPDSGGVDPPV